MTPEMKHMSLASTALSHDDKDAPPHPKKKVKEMHIRKGASGGHIIRHIHETHPDEEHTVPHMDALHDHLEEHMGEPDEGEPEDPAQAQMESMVGYK